MDSRFPVARDAHTGFSSLRLKFFELSLKNTNLGLLLFIVNVIVSKEKQSFLILVNDLFGIAVEFSLARGIQVSI